MNVWRGLPWRAAVVAAALAVVVTACGQAPEGQLAGEDQGGADPGLEHVHGLGVDPADGVLYAASHYGVFRIPPDGEPERVGDRRQDTMGFTVVGPGRFLASGHPDPREENQPAHLGLIESTDAGQTWRSLSLAGEADFHALEAKHNLVYGYDSQTRQVMVSADQRTWDRRARLAMADFAVHPANPDVLLATTQQGMARSTDGGRTFAPVPGAPALLLVDWPTQDTLVGVDPQGGVHLSADAGATWVRHGQVPGQPEALGANAADEVYVATDTGIYASNDSGRSFAARHKPG